jgi:hypothetical protein
MISYIELIRMSETTGFHPESLERADLLFEILESLHSHLYLKQRIALKGRTCAGLAAGNMGA